MCACHGAPPRRADRRIYTYLYIGGGILLCVIQTNDTIYIGMLYDVLYYMVRRNALLLLLLL